MRRLGAKGGKRRKSETSSDADSGENGGGNADTANESLNSSDSGNNIENTETPAKATPNNKKRSRPRSKRGDDTGSANNSDPHNKDNAEMGEEQTNNELDTTPVVEKENGNERKNSAKKRKKDKSKTTAAAAAASTSQDNDNEYEVEKIVAHRTIKGRRQFLVRWKGYNEDSDTWEQEKDLNCPKLIENFLADEEDKQEEHLSEESEKNENKNDNDNGNSIKTETTASKSKKPRKSVGKKDKQPQSTKKQKAQTEADGDSEEEEEDAAKEFEVEKIIEVHFKKNKEREFLIRWKGFNANDDTWEPEENLNCPELISKFMEKVKKAKSSEGRELRTNPAHTKRYTLTTHESGRRWSRRNVDKQRTTYYQCDE